MRCALVALAALGACGHDAAAPVHRAVTPAVVSFVLAPWDAAAPTRARVQRSLGGVVAETIDIETSAWASPTRSLVVTRTGEAWLETCDDYDAAQARCPHPVWIRVYPGAHVHRTSPP